MTRRRNSSGPLVRVGVRDVGVVGGHGVAVALARALRLVAEAPLRVVDLLLRLALLLATALRVALLERVGGLLAASCASSRSRCACSEHVLTRAIADLASCVRRASPLRRRACPARPCRAAPPSCAARPACAASRLHLRVELRVRVVELLLGRGSPPQKRSRSAARFASSRSSIALLPAFSASFTLPSSSDFAICSACSRAARALPSLESGLAPTSGSPSPPGAPSPRDP